MDGKRGSPISRREFARRAAIASAASIVPANALPVHAAIPESSFPQTPNTSSLSAESKAEAEARFQGILSAYGSRFSDAQKSELRRLCSEAQPPLDRLRAYTVENGDAPALYLKPLVEREKKTAPAVLPRATNPAAQKP